MALAHIHFFSESIGMSTSLYATLPEIRFTRRTERPSLLVLLHGRTDDHSSWIRKIPVERYAQEKNLVIVMPEVGLSYYSDMGYGRNYLSFVGKEIPAIARSFFRVSDESADTHIAGISMGGYGAFKAAFTYPESFSSVCSFSGALDIVGRIELCRGNDDSILLGMFSDCFGGSAEVGGTKHDLFHLLSELKRTGTRIPNLRQYCGTEDFLYKGNRNFLKFCRENLIPIEYEESPGAHEWDYWDRTFRTYLDCLIKSRSSD